MQGRLVADRYRLGDAIGSGGMGRVWRAHDEVLHRTVAIKELTAALYVTESDQAVLLARTRGEARAAARINHSAVVTVHDVLEHDGRPWIVMELVEGRSLADAVKEEQRVEPREAARIGLWVLRALCAAHAAGVLHRDVKPGNVLLGRDGRVLLTDFGIAQIEGDSTITRTGEVVGSVDYLAPERVRGHDPGPASDLWALGATLYTAVEGVSPFRRTSPLTTMQAVVEEQTPEPRNAGPLAPVIEALLRKDPAARPPAAEAERLLAAAAEGRHPGAPPAAGYGDTGQGPGHTAVGHPAPGYPTAGQPAAGHPATGYPHTGHPATGPTAMGPAPAWPPAATGPTPTGPMTHTGPVPAAGPLRRRLRTLALIVVVAALVGGGTAVWLQSRDEGRGSGQGGAGPTPGPTTSATSGPSPSTSASEGDPSPGPSEPSDSVPAGWTRRDDPAGFSLSLPEGWKREEFTTDGGLKQIDYSPDGGRNFLRVAVETDPDYDDPVAHQRDLEAQLQGLADYHRVTLAASTYRDRKSAHWEYTWTARAKDTPFPGPRRAVEETYISRDGTEYAIYMSSPAENWPTTREQFRTVLRSWEEQPG
ncbi:serine/threonine-protein kinase [Streptomyces sp. NPDC003717]|uniref:serine/threonine-protein kinase n=1 Tax=Streptomyces sp. NPDC003717 TaxID=3154276 RepID=UPI0033BB1497